MQVYHLKYELLILLLLSWNCMPSKAKAQERHKPTIGIITGKEQDSLFAKHGYPFREEGVGNTFSPRRVSEQDFLKNVDRVLGSQCKVLSANSFFHGYIKLVGPDRNEALALGYADTVFRRCHEAGLKIVVLGSGDARRIPDGYDHALARDEFISLVKKMAVLAGKHGITIAMENLNRGETNLGNSLEEVVGMVKEVGSRHFRATADIYHMLREHESASSIDRAGKLLVHCHIAENKDRARPGKNGEDFRTYFQAMKRVHYRGLIMMECGWTNMADEATPALVYLQGQLDEVYQ
jgi:sugar phosphate isomerase/epimerase